MVIIYSMQQPPLINGPPAGSALQRDAVVVRRFSKCVIDYKPQSSSLQPTNPTASLMVSLVTVFSQLFVGEVLRIFGSWQTATTAAAALFFFFYEVFENHCHCTPVTGNGISQLVARRAVGVRTCQASPSWPEQSRTEDYSPSLLLHVFMGFT